MYERTCSPFQYLDRFDAAPDDEHVQRPESEEADPHARGRSLGGRPENLKHGEDGLSSDPGLNAEPSASYQGAQNRRHIRPAHSERGAHENRERDAVASVGMGVEQ